MNPQKLWLRTSIGRFGTAVLLALGAVCFEAPQAAAQPAVSVDVFYDSLAPYGEWLHVGQFGRVWRPRVSIVGLEFRPYATAGHWEYTDYGWSFVSEYDWGWAPFHYGRWLPDPDFGWVWVPGTTWAPAWVDWRYGDGYVGWAPLAPIGARLILDTYYPAWCFVPTRHFLARDFYHYASPIEHVHRHFGATAPLHNEVAYGGARWFAGPPPGHVASAAGQPVHPVAVTPPPPGVVQRIHLGTPTSVTVSAPGVHGGSLPAGAPSSNVHATSAGWSHQPAPGVNRPPALAPAPTSPASTGQVAPRSWSGSQPSTMPAPPPRYNVQSSPAPAAAPAPGPRLQPGWGAQPTNSGSPPAGRSGAPQSLAPQFHSAPNSPALASAPRGQFMTPAPPRASTFSPPAPAFHAPQQMTTVNRPTFQVPQSTPMARATGPTFQPPAAPTMRSPAAVSPSYHAAPPTSASYAPRGGVSSPAPTRAPTVGSPVTKGYVR